MSQSQNEQPTSAVAPVQSNGMATASLVLGIIGLVLDFIPLMGVVSWVLGPLAIIFGAIGMKKTFKAGTAKAGLILGIIIVIIKIIATIFLASLFASLM